MTRAARSIVVGSGMLALCCLSSVAVAALPQLDPVVVAQAPNVASVKAEIIVLHATNDGKGIDPGIGKMPELGEPPFSAYNSYKLLEKFELDLPKGETKDKKLPDGGKLAVKFKDATKGKKKDARGDRFVASSRFEVLDPGVTVPDDVGADR